MSSCSYFSILLAYAFLPAFLQAAERASIVTPDAKLQMLAEGFSFTEGPAADSHGNIYFTDQPNDRIVKWSTDGKTTDWLKPAGRSKATYLDNKGNLITSAEEKHGSGRIPPYRKFNAFTKDS